MLIKESDVESFGVLCFVDLLQSVMTINRLPAVFVLPRRPIESNSKSPYVLYSFIG